MTIPLSQLIQNFETMISELESSWPDIVARMGSDSIALIEERITKTGKDAQGNPLRKYTKPYQKFKEQPQNYKRGKELGLGSNRFTGVTDYTLTGLLWKGIKVLKVSEQSDTVVATIGADTVGNQQIIESLTKRDGFPLQLSESEKQIVTENALSSVSSIINKYIPSN